MALSLKINLVTLNLTKTLRFNADLSISEVCKDIREKTSSGGTDHGLFQATPKPRWLKPEKTLKYYDLQSGNELEYKKKHRQLKIKLLDDTIKTVLVDDSTDVSDITNVIGTRMDIKNPEEFSLKLLTSNSWLNPALTLTEQGIKEDDVLLLKKKFFFNDANVDKSDPLQLHLLYIQSTDAVVSGDHLTSRQEACDLAALQLQVQYGNYNPEKANKPGWLNLKAVLPPQHQKSRNIDKDILKEYSKLINTETDNGKYKYIQLCRSLKTYGITFFDIKTKVKKKLTPQLLGVTRHSVIQLDPETKEVIKEYPLTHLKRWAPSATSISLDFGDYEDDYLTLATPEGDSISQLISGYIDIILKTRKDAARVLEDDEGEAIEEEHLAPVRGYAVNTTTTNMVGGNWDPSGGQAGVPGIGGLVAGREMQGGMTGTMLNAYDLGSALQACSALIDQYLDPAMAVPGADSVALAQAMMALGTAAGEVSALAPEGGAPLDAAASSLAQQLKNLIEAAKKSAAENGDDISLLDGAKAISEAVRKLLHAAAMVAKDPNDPKAIEALRAAQLALKGAEAFLAAAAAGTLADQATQNLLNESAKMVAAAIASLLSETDPLLRGMKDQRAQVDAFNKLKATAGAAQRLCATVSTVSPAILDKANQQTLQQKCQELERILQAVLPALAAGGLSEPEMERLNNAAKRAMEAIQALVTSSHLASQKGYEPQDLITPSQTIVKEVSKLSNESKGNPQLIGPSTAAIQEAVSQLLKATKVVAEENPALKENLLNEAKALIAALGKLTESSKKAQSNQDTYTMQQLATTSANVEEASKAILKTARSAVIDSVKYWAKNATAATTGLVATSIASSSNADPTTRQALVENASAAASKVSVVLNAIERCNNDPNDQNAQQALLAASKGFAHPSASLVAVAKRAVPRVSDMTKKTALHSAADDVAQALKNLMFAVQIAADEGPTKEVTEALEQLNFISADLDAAAFAAASGSLPRITGNPEAAIDLLAAAIANLRSTIPPLEGAAHKNPQAVGPPAKNTSGAVYQTVNAAKTLASYAADSDAQKKIIQTCRALVQVGQAVIDAAVDLSHAPTDKVLDDSLQQKKQELERLLTKLLSSSPQPGYKEIQEAMQKLEGLLNSMSQVNDNRGTSLKQLNDACKSLGIATSNALTASRIDAKQMGPHTVNAAEAVDEIVDAAKTAAASGQSGGQVSVQGLDGPISKIIAELKDIQNNPNKVEAAKNIAKLNSEVVAASKRACQTSLKDKPQARRNLILANEKLTNASSALARAAKNGTITPLVIQNMHDAIRSLNNAGASGGSGGNAKDLVDATRSCAEATLQLVNAAGALSGNPKDAALQAKFSSAAKNIPGTINTVQTAALQLLPGVRECDESGLYIGKIIADLDAFALFAAAGQVDPEELAPGKNYEDCQNGIHQSGADMKKAAQAFKAALRGSQEDLANAARDLTRAAADLANYTKATGALGADKNAQSALIEACIKCESECQTILSKGKDAHGNMDRFDGQISQLVNNIDYAVQDMDAEAEKAAAESARGIVEIDKATRFIQEAIGQYNKPGYKGNPSADASSLVKSARVVASSTGDLVVGAQSSQEELVAAAMKAAQGVKALLEEGKGGGATTDDPQVRARVDEACLKSAAGVNKLLAAAKAGSKSQTLQSQVAISSAAREAADQLQEVVSAANQLPGGEGLTLEEETGQDLDDLAEKELRACAQVIENAARTLQTSQQSHSGDLALEGVAEAIMVAAVAIAQATTLLVKAAHGAQKERVANLGNPKTKHLYRRDPVWADGLISAAKKVAATTQHLVTAANGAVEGKAEEEELIASAKQVSSSTAHLVSASRAKSDPNSATSKQLSAAAKAVAEATQKLVDAAKQQREAKPIAGYELDSGAKAELEQQIEILKLEKALEDARKKLTTGRTQNYQKGK